MTTGTGASPDVKLGLISDVHGDMTALELAWAHLTVLGADRIVCAGDLVGYGPYPDRAVVFLQAHKIASVRGNHDRWALQRPPSTPDEFGGPGISTTFPAIYVYDLMFQRGQIGEGAAAAIMMLAALAVVLVPYSFWVVWRRRKEAGHG